MKKSIPILILFLLHFLHVQTQETKLNDTIYKISKDFLAGEGLDFKKQKDSTRTVYQKRVYNGNELAVYMIAIGTDITNEFESFPMEEFIFWINGKAVVEPKGEEAIEIHSGEYFIQAKGFSGKWNFVDTGGLHLELALIAKNRPDKQFKSPITKALVIDKNILSGVVKPSKGLIYKGPEITVNLLNTESDLTKNHHKERMLHIINGIITVESSHTKKEKLYPGDFFIVSEGFNGRMSSNSLQDLRVLEIFKSERNDL